MPPKRRQSEEEEKDGQKKVSSFQALMISTASRVGTGNIAGIATAIAAGGPGAVVWMWLMAVIGGASDSNDSWTDSGSAYGTGVESCGYYHGSYGECEYYRNFPSGGIVMKALKDYEIQRKNGKRPVFKGEKKRTRTCGMRISYVKNSMMLCFGQ